MKLSLSLLLVASLLILPLSSRADAAAKKSKKAHAAATQPAGKEVTLTGSFGCAKCSFKEADACRNILKVKEGGKDVTYELGDNQTSKDQHEAICHSPGKPATVTGTVSEVAGKKTITASEIKFN